MFVLDDSSSGANGAVFALNTSTTAGRRDSSGGSGDNGLALSYIRPSSIVMLRQSERRGGGNSGHGSGDGDDGEGDEKQSWWESPHASQEPMSWAQIVQVCIHTLVLLAVPIAVVLTAYYSDNKALPYVYSFFVALASFEYAWLAYRVRLRLFLPFKLHQKQTSKDIYAQIMSYSVDLETCAVTPLAERLLQGRKVMTALLLGLACAGVTVAVCLIPGLEESPMAFSVMSVFLVVFCASLAPNLPDGFALLLRYGFYFIAVLNVVMTLNDTEDADHEDRSTVMNEPLTLEPFSIALLTASLLLISRVFTSKEPMESAVMVLLDIAGLLYVSCAATVLGYFSRSVMSYDNNNSSTGDNDEEDGGESHKNYALIAFFVIVWSSELGSFFMERFLKFIDFPWNHPIAKRVSSRQNVEKLVGALLGSVAATFVVSEYVDFHMETNLVACLTAAAVVLSQVCKLFLLSLKKIAKIPATGEYLALGGGILDRIDTILFMAIVFSPFFEHQVGA